MILLWCLLGITLAFGIGRYHQSNKLFWALFTSFVIGIAGASVYNKIVAGDQSEVRSETQVYPTQDHSTTVTYFVRPEAEEALCQEPAPVGQELTPGYERSNKLASLWVGDAPCPPPRNV